MTRNHRLKIGDRVYWNDPDGGLCSGWGRVVDIGDDNDRDTIVFLDKENGDGVAAFLGEIDPPEEE